LTLSSFKALRAGFKFQRRKRRFKFQVWLRRAEGSGFTTEKTETKQKNGKV